MPISHSRRPARQLVLPVALIGLTLSATLFSSYAAAPEIRLGENNRVPQCVTPERLMQYLAARNAALDPKYKDIAAHFKKHGEALRVRWDYAFFQMILETNSLKFGGDVSARQNNFAGLGATGGGVKGESFPDVSTGVLAQMQHLVAYSGERVESPVAQRTREQQDGIVAKSLRLRRPVQFADLTKRWAADRKYIRSIEAIAEGFRTGHCMAPEPVAREETAPAPRPARKAGTPDGKALAARAVAEDAANAVTRTNLGAQRACHVWQASYGGSAAVLIRAEKDGVDHFTVLGVEAGAEDKLATAFIASHAAGGTALGAYDNADAALTEAFTRCPN